MCAALISCSCVHVHILFLFQVSETAGSSNSNSIFVLSTAACLRVAEYIAEGDVATRKGILTKRLRSFSLWHVYSVLSICVPDFRFRSHFISGKPIYM